MASPAFAEIMAFGEFEAKLGSRELYRNGVRVRLPEQSFHVLAMLLERRGELVTREEIRQRLWPADTFVDFDHGLNNAVNRLREALGDSADSPRFIETLPRRGYRFVAPLLHTPSAASPVSAPTSISVAAAEEQPTVRKWLPVASACLVLLGILTPAAMHFRGQASASPIGSLAVLPLENVSGDPGQEYFADGMTDSLITNLASLKSVRVISRTSAMHCKGSHKILAEIARELKVDAVVEGTIMRVGDRVHINVQLIDARTDRHLWANAYDRDLRDVLALQAELASTITSQVASRVEQQGQITARRVDPEAYDAYLRGQQEWAHAAWTPDGYEKSRRYFNRAIQLDPEYADAIVALAVTYMTNDAAAARALALRALELNNSVGAAHAVLASMKCANEWDFVGAESEFKRAIELEPNSVTTHSWYGFFLAEIGQSEAALRELRTAESLDPLSLDVQADIGLVLYEARRYVEAEQVLQRTLRQDPKTIIAHRHLVRIYAAREQIPEYLNEIVKTTGWYKATPEEMEAGTQRLRAAYAAGGTREFWRAYLEHELRKPWFPHPIGLARLYAHLGDRDRCIAILEKLYEERDLLLAVWVNSDPEFDNVRSDPRFQSLLKKIGFPR